MTTDPDKPPRRYLRSERGKRDWFRPLRREGFGWTSYGPPGRWLRFQMWVNRTIYGRRRR